MTQVEGTGDPLVSQPVRSGSRFTARQFPVGCNVTIRYRELTAAGVPKEARYWRHRPEGE